MVALVITMLNFLLGIPFSIRNKNHNNIVDDVIENKKLIALEKPRWIKTGKESGYRKVGYVNKLHPTDIERGFELNFSPHDFTPGGVYFIRNQKCFRHENKQGSQTHYDFYDDTTYTSYYYYQIVYFNIQGRKLTLHSDDYSPAFDNSITYDIIFQVSDVEENSIRGKILKVFVQEDAAKDIPEEWEGNVPSTPQRMKNNTKKAAIA